MARKFKTVDYEEALEMTVKMRDVLPADHLVHFVVFVGLERDIPTVCPIGWAAL